MRRSRSHKLPARHRGSAACSKSKELGTYGEYAEDAAAGSEGRLVLSSLSLGLETDEIADEACEKIDAEEREHADGPVE